MQSIVHVLKVVIVMPLIIATFLFFYAGNCSALIDVEEGDAPKQFSMKSLDGRVVSLSDMDGNPIIIVFWKLMDDKSFLDYSKDELLFLNNYYKRLHLSEQLEVVGVYIPKDQYSTHEEVQKIKQLADTHKIAFPVVIDEGMKLYEKYGIIALPSTFMVGSGGEIEYISTSFPLSAGPVFSQRITELVSSRESGIHLRTAAKIEPAERRASYSTQHKCTKRLC